MGCLWGIPFVSMPGPGLICTLNPAPFTLAPVPCRIEEPEFKGHGNGPFLVSEDSEKLRHNSFFKSGLTPWVPGLLPPDTPCERLS